MNIDTNQRKILLAVDGSDRALNMVRYIAKVEPFHKMHVVLFHVFSSVPDSYWDLEKDPIGSQTVRKIRSWEIQQEKYIRQFIQQINQFLVKAGFPSNSIEVRIQKRNEGIARDIIQEALNGYEAVVVRRRGSAGLRGIILGGVAAKLLEKLAFIPMMMIGNKPPGDKLLLAFDGSDNATRAVDFVGSLLGGHNYKVRLLHVIRGKENKRRIQQTNYAPKEHTQATKKAIEHAIEKAKAKLIESGFKPHNVSYRIITGAFSRAGAIAQEARQGGYGTIVLGRRGLSRLQEFFIGRVTNKVIHLARDRSVWVVR
ncbi:MAG: universal stress protein [Desulfobacterales bacterium]|nr:MAG: universal stress protein [Desulfobacterales bacterium]